MKPKYKIGDRVVYEGLNKEGDPIEKMAYIYSIQINLNEIEGGWVIYADIENNEFCETDILHKLVIYKPRKSKANKIVEEMKKSSSLSDFIVGAMDHDPQA